MNEVNLFGDFYPEITALGLRRFRGEDRSPTLGLQPTHGRTRSLHSPNATVTLQASLASSSEVLPIN